MQDARRRKNQSAQNVLVELCTNESINECIHIYINVVYVIHVYIILILIGSKHTWYTVQ